MPAGSDGGVKGVMEYTNGGADIVMDFVGEKGTPETSMAMLRKGGTYSIIGYGGTVTRTTLKMIFASSRSSATSSDSYTDLAELMELAQQGRSTSQLDVPAGPAPTTCSTTWTPARLSAARC